MRLSDVIIVLSRPSRAGNVGAVCRAMKNMGLSRLRLAAPEFESGGSSVSALSGGAREEGRYTHRGDLAPELSESGLDYGGNLAVIKARAIHALDVWERAESFASLGAALKDCALVIGTTRRRGRHRKQVTMTAAETAAFLKKHPGPAALVFGNERTGLEDGELELCNFASHIPVDEAFPSLNLSHAVQIYAYELFRALGEPLYGGASSLADSALPREEGAYLPGDSSPPPPAVKGQWVPLDQAAIEELAARIIGDFRILGFYKQAGREEQERFFRDIFSRAGISEREGSYFADLITRAVRLALKAAGSP